MEQNVVVVVLHCELLCNAEQALPMMGVCK